MKAITIDLNSFIPAAVINEPLLEPKHKRGKIDVTFLVLVLILLTVGLVMLFSASHAFAFYNEGNSFYYIERQLFFAVVGVAAMLFVSQVNYKILQKYSILLYAGAVALLLIADIFMRDQYGFARWIYIGSFSFQPASGKAISIRSRLYSKVLILSVTGRSLSSKTKTSPLLK